MSDQKWTVGRLLAWTADYLRQHGAENPRLDAEVLLAHSRRCERIELYAAFGEAVDEHERSLFRDLVRRRAAGTPVAYLVGQKEFYSLTFQVTPDVLIPRPETEFLVVAALDWLKARGEQPAARIVDVGTGSGCVAVSIAKHAERAEVVAVDISAAALAVAQSNAALLGVTDRLGFLESDLLAAFPAEPQFDLVVSNPPYIGLREKPTLSPQVRDHEPALALYGGETGIETTTKLVQQAAPRLKPGGMIALEISPFLVRETESLFHDNPLWTAPKIIKDLAGQPRICQASRL